MELQFSRSQEDWQDFVRASPRMSGWQVIQFCLTFVPLFFLGCYLAEDGFIIAGWSCVVLSVAIGLAGYEMPIWQLRQKLQASAFANAKVVLSTGDNGIALTYPGVRTEFEWRAFVRWRETKTLFLFFLSSEQIGLWIPKRAMSQEQVEQLRQILKGRFL
jgi:YcxB-like protein